MSKSVLYILLGAACASSWWALPFLTERAIGDRGFIMVPIVTSLGVLAAIILESLDINCKK